MPYQDISESISSLWQVSLEFLNSAFASAFLSALAGAIFGVLGAQRLAERATRRKELLDALRQTNALIVLVATIANQAMSLKKQHIEPLSIDYFKERERAVTLNDFYLHGSAPDKISFHLEMMHITPLNTPIEALKNITYSAQLIPGMAIALVSMVEQSLIEMTHSIRIRSEQIERFKSQEMSSVISIQNYFGLLRKDGNTDALYHDSMVAIRDYTNDVIFFAVELTEELQAHANKIHEKLSNLTKDAAKANAVDYSTPRKLGIIPPRKDYESWLSGFKSHE
ncbi:hypothetical protein ACEUAP_04375 [Aeromonas veronii]